MSHLPREFLNVDNFALAFRRISRSLKSDYKQYYRHILPSYQLSLIENLESLIGDIRREVYIPSAPTIIYLPKKSGVLRPLTLLSFRDLIVYQSIINVVAARMRPEQRKYAYKKTFGAILSRSDSPHFFHNWKPAYGRFTSKVRESFHLGNDYMAEFDLVACYELIDHGILRSCISKRVNSEELLNLLFHCLSSWTTNLVGRHLRHGIPQGPDASAFLAECVMFGFDAMPLKGVDYFRYIDDIRLMAKDEVPLRRALLKLDLKCKDLGLVPQAQKINSGKIEDIDMVTKSIPSMVLASVESGQPGSAGALNKLFRESMKKEKGEWRISDDTRFKYALNRMNPRKDVLQKVRKMMPHRPDMSSDFARYLSKFGCSKEASDVLLEALKQDPTYDASAADYIGALDLCEPSSEHEEYRRIVNTAKKRSEENSILIRIAILSFQGKRRGPKDAMNLVGREQDPRVRNMVLHALFGKGEHTPFKISSCKDLLEREVEGEDEELARYCAFILLIDSLEAGRLWTPGKAANDAVKLMFAGLKIHKKKPKQASILDEFFHRAGIKAGFSWRKALGSRLKDAEARSIRLIHLMGGDQTAYVLMLDTFNEVLIQGFSEKHPLLNVAYAKAAGKNAQPDFGNWLTNGTFAGLMGQCTIDLKAIHDARVKADLAHARSKKGKPTKRISFKEAAQLRSVSIRAWRALLAEWFKIIP